MCLSIRRRETRGSEKRRSEPGRDVPEPRAGPSDRTPTLTNDYPFGSQAHRSLSHIRCRMDRADGEGRRSRLRHWEPPHGRRDLVVETCL